MRLAVIRKQTLHGLALLLASTLIAGVTFNIVLNIRHGEKLKELQNASSELEKLMK
ncbi:hypothetical protein ACFLS1_10865 [Verrucomicrobiota bacterium]